MSFEYGIASGDVTETSVVLWTKVTTRQAVGWKVEADDSPTRMGEILSDPDGFVHLLVDGLSPGTKYRYRFYEATEASPWGNFKTIPKQQPVNFGVVSCAKYNSGYFNAYRRLAQLDDLDFILHLGDYIYEAGQVPRANQTPGIDIGRSFDPHNDCITFDDYNRRYAQYRMDGDVQAMHRQHAMVFVLDDHELADNAWMDGAAEHFPSDGSWKQRLFNALRSWERWQPTLRRPTEGGALWQRISLGEVGNLFLCDSRLSRTDPVAPDGPGKSILGQPQRESIVEQMTEEKPWFILGMPSKLLSFDSARGTELNDEALIKLKISDGDGGAYYDLWDSYGHERDWLVTQALSAKGSPALICGDVHFSAYSEIKSNARTLPEFVVTSVTSANLDDKMGWPHGGKSRKYEDSLVASISEMKWCDLDRHGYMIVGISKESLTGEWWAVDTVTQPSDRVELIRRETISRQGLSVPAEADERGQGHSGLAERPS